MKFWSVVSGDRSNTSDAASFGGVEATMIAADPVRECEALADGVRRLLARECGLARVRQIMESDSGHDRALWHALAAAGIVGLIIPETCGGVGMGAVALGLIMEEVGAALLPAPLISTMMASVLLEGDDLKMIADGSRIVAVTFAGRNGWTRSGVVVEGGRLFGSAGFVPDAQVADIILVATDEAVFVVDRSETEITPLPVFDRTRRMADVAFDGPARRISDASRVGRACDLGVAALAGEQAGGARRMLEMTVAYVAQRHQFGRAVGSFQAIKHMAADLLLTSESAVSAARDAALQLEQDRATKDAAIALAAFVCADAFVKVASDAIQMHGGVAFTWDHPAHLYLRRARSAAQLFGASRGWRERYITCLEAET